MSNEIIPVSYLDESGIGKVYITGVEGPPLTLCEPDANDGNMHLALEFENHIKAASGEDPVMRLCLHLSGGRKLCHNLISALAKSGDRIAIMIESKMQEAMNESLMRDMREKQEKTTLN